MSLLENCFVSCMNAVLVKKNKKLPESASGRNQNCKAKLDITIKLVTANTIQKDKFLQEKPCLQGEVSISTQHSHNIQVASGLKFMRPGEHIKEIFMRYYEDNMSPAEALRLHADDLLADEEGAKKLANAHHMPQDQTAYYWHRQFRELNYGPPAAPFETLKQKVGLCKDKGVTIVLREESPWAVLIVTPEMKRAQELFWSKNLVFVDTSSSCDSTSTNVTPMMTATKAGSIPIAVFLHESQTAESYEAAFEFLKTHFPRAFGDNEQPLALMSDNSAAEKMGFRKTWPGVIELLCGFHVSAAEWEWIFSNVMEEFRKPLMVAFQKIQYASSESDLLESIEAIKTTASDYYEKRLKGLLESQKERVQLFRSGLPIGGHYTNNFSESTMRILKDVILERIKSYNIVALIDYLAVKWEKYLVTRLMWFAYNRKARPHALYADLIQRMPAGFEEKIKMCGEGTFHVPSATIPNTEYEVIVALGLCACRAGRAGAFCKHQALVHKVYGGAFPNCPPVTSADRYLLGVLAMGDKCPEKSFFLDMKENLEDLEKNLKELQALYTISPESQEMGRLSTIETPQFSQPDSPAPVILGLYGDPAEQQSIKEAFFENMSRLLELGSETNISGFYKFVAAANKGLQKIPNSNKAFEAMMRMAAGFKSTTARSGKAVGVQPKSIGRRKPGFTKGNKRVPSGRRSKQLRVLQHKRTQKLGESVKASRRHRKKH